MTTFSLVHGGLHGGWCWELVTPILEAAGHTVVAPDLPTEVESAGASRCAEVVVSALDVAGASDDVITVGHSLAGMVIPVIASQRPVRLMVFLGAMVPQPGAVYADYLAAHPDAVIVSEPEEGQVPPYETIRDYFYNDCREEVVRQVYERLRPQPTTVFTEVCPLRTWPDTQSRYILMTEDRCVGNSWSRRVAETQLGTEPIPLPGSHSPFYSRPRELAEILLGL